jgi:uncharacterized protein YdeI (YjbR/CyaY-like superfamily)
MNKDVDKFFQKSRQWQPEMVKLRTVLLKAGLEESLKWGKPCYSRDGANVAIIQPFKACLGLMFFKGTLLKDAKKLLVDNGPNSQAAKRLEFTSVQEVAKLAPAVRSYVREASALEAAGTKVSFRKKPEPIPAELKAMFTRHPKLKIAFAALTPGRQRAYILHFSGAKQAATRQSRIEKCMPRILAGKGMTDR